MPIIKTKKPTPDQKPVAKKAAAKPRPKEPLLNSLEIQSQPVFVNTSHHAAVENPDPSMFYDTGLGFLLLKTQTIKNGCIYELIDAEDGEADFYEVCTPPIPKDITRVPGYGRPLDDQVFERTKEPSYMDLDFIDKKVVGPQKRISDYTLDARQEEWVNREYDRIWIDGYWFFNRGVLTWMTPHYYGELNYWDIGIATNDGYKDYRDADRRFYMMWRDVELSALEIGIVQPKFRRMGASQRGFWLKFWTARSGMKKNTGYMMDAGDKAREEFTQNFVGPYNRMPLWLRNTDTIAVDSSKVLLTYRSTLSGKIHGTNSLINWKSTTEQGYNGKGLGYMLLDEAGKLPIDLSYAWNKVLRYCFTLGGGSSKLGQAYLPSTLEDMTQGRQFRDLVEQSRRKTYNPILKSTTSGLRFYFQPATDGLENFCDKWGYSIVEDPVDQKVVEWRVTKGHLFPTMGTKSYIQTRLDDLSKKGEWDNYTNFLRAHPRHIADMFVEPAGQNGFNADKVQKLVVALESSQHNTNTMRKGRFVPIDERNLANPKIIWEDDPISGEWETNLLFKDWDRDANRVRLNDGVLEPLNIDWGCITYDPYQKGIVIDKKNGSKGAGHVLKFFNIKEMENMYNSGIPGVKRLDFYPSPSLPSAYYARPMDIDDSYKQIVYAAIYFGIRIAHENNHDGLTEFCRTRKLLKFLVPANEFYVPEERSPSRDGMYGFRMDEDAPVYLQSVYAFVNGRSSYLRGWNYEIQHELERCPHKETAKDFLAFNIAHRKKFDRTMSVVPGFRLMEVILYMQMYQGERRDGEPEFEESWHAA